MEPSSVGSQNNEITPFVLSRFLLPEIKQQAGGRELGFIKKSRMAIKESTEKQEQELEA